MQYFVPARITSQSYALLSSPSTETHTSPPVQVIDDLLIGLRRIDPNDPRVGSVPFPDYKLGRRLKDNQDLLSFGIGDHFTQGWISLDSVRELPTILDRS